ncbi:MAG: type II toxin-antitoxin system RelE/ParE family toxin [Bacteroidia bacterium]
MEKKTLQVVVSSKFNRDISDIHKYGTETFGLKYADFFISEIFEEVEKLTILSQIHPECKHLTTKSKKYRNIIIGAYLIIYRVNKRVEVLRAMHVSKSPTSINATRGIKI